MKYVEGDFYDGPLTSCYLQPLYHPACMGCSDRNDCYGEEEYLRFRVKAMIMSKLLDDPKCLTLENSAKLAAALDKPDSVDRIQRVLTGKHCKDGKIWSIMKIALDIPF